MSVKRIHKNQDVYNLWKCQLTSLCLQREHSENAFRMFVLIPTWIFCLRMTEIHFVNYITNFTYMVIKIHLTELFQGMFDTIIKFTPSKFHV